MKRYTLLIPTKGDHARPVAVTINQSARLYVDASLPDEGILIQNEHGTLVMHLIPDTKAV